MRCLDAGFIETFLASPLRSRLGELDRTDPLVWRVEGWQDHVTIRRRIIFFCCEPGPIVWTAIECAGKEISDAKRRSCFAALSGACHE
jgi:hypothetical protein